MKQIITFFLAFSLLLVLAGCGGEPATPQVTESTPSASTQPASTAEPESQTEEDGIQTVTVSTIEELAEALQSDTKVILKAGVYNFSELDPTKVQNLSLQSDLSGDAALTGGGNYEYTLYNVSGLSLEAEKGAEVTVVTEVARARVLAFALCGDISIKGITCGHDVQPGFCTGSVIYAYDTDSLTVESCNLYGSGTYGVEAADSTNVKISNTEIYDCSDGIVSLYNIKYADILDCKLHDNRGSSLFMLRGCENVTIKNDEIYNNELSDIYLPPVNDEGALNIMFTGCTFRDNNVDPDPYENRNIYYENCVYETPQAHIGYAKIRDYSKESGEVWLAINEVVWINPEDEALMFRFGVTYDDMMNDYYLADEDSTYNLCLTYKDSTEYSILKPDAVYGLPESTPVDWEEFVAALESAPNGELLVSYKVDCGAGMPERTLLSIEQVYVP